LANTIPASKAIPATALMVASCSLGQVKSV
jgi:hypothetical protein